MGGRPFGSPVLPPLSGLLAGRSDPIQAVARRGKAAAKRSETPLAKERSSGSRIQGDNWIIAYDDEDFVELIQLDGLLVRCRGAKSTPGDCEIVADQTFAAAVAEVEELGFTIARRYRYTGEQFPASLLEQEVEKGLQHALEEFEGRGPVDRIALKSDPAAMTVFAVAGHSEVDGEGLDAILTPDEWSMDDDAGALDPAYRVLMTAHRRDLPRAWSCSDFEKVAFAAMQRGATSFAQEVLHRTPRPLVVFECSPGETNLDEVAALNPGHAMLQEWV